MADALATTAEVDNEDAGGATSSVSDSSVIRSLQALGPMRLAFMAGVAIVLIGFFIFLSVSMGSSTMSPIFTNLPIEDSGEVVAELEKRGVKYELRANGSQIMVPANDVLRLRMALAQEGLPGTGSVVGYEIFDQTDAMGTSNFVLNVNMLRALEGELSRTIGSFKGVDSARVHLVVPKRELFTRDRREPTASVALDLRGSSELSKSEIGAIRHLVATAVPGLKSAKITIVDSKGRLLARGLADGEEEDAFSSDADEYRINYEKRMRRTIEELLASSVGASKVRAEVTADIDFDRIVVKSETFDPESQVARSIQESSETERSTEKDLKENVTVGNNLPDANAGEAGILESRSLDRSDATTNFEISKEVKNHITETGTINRLSVAVLVDGTYALNEEGETVYSPRNEAALTQMAQLVKSAIGFDASRGDTVEVINMPFDSPEELEAPEEPLGWLRDELQGIVQTLVIGLVAMMAILMIIKPLVTRAIEATRIDPELEAAEKAALGAPTLAGQLTDQRFEEDDDDDLINVDRVQGRIKSASFRKINEIVDQHPDEALTILRQWIQGTDD
ncbi:MAG: flagellar basal-body MS-ring/collar protein FliF [Rickettsiales bacterium]|nr:flagellar basal-body MS-ring/collar protein FliF [Rickettsiales bacterium]